MDNQRRDHLQWNEETTERGTRTSTFARIRQLALGMENDQTARDWAMCAAVTGTRGNLDQAANWKEELLDEMMEPIRDTIQPQFQRFQCTAFAPEPGSKPPLLT
ncbi:unnamed protein product [Merluccius merluccius]